MDDSPVERELEVPDGEPPLVRDRSSWYGRVLGEEWESVEPGIYKRVERLTQLEPPDSPREP